MEEKKPDTNKRRMTITVDHAVYEKLPRGENKSAYINEILRTHYQLAGFEQLYKRIIKRMEEEGRFSNQPKELEQTVMYKGMSGTPSQFSLPPIPHDMQGLELAWDHFQHKYREIEL